MDDDYRCSNMINVLKTGSYYAEKQMQKKTVPSLELINIPKGGFSFGLGIYGTYKNLVFFF